MSVKLSTDVLTKAKNLIKETLDFYYNEDFTPKPTRSVDDTAASWCGTTCRYTMADGRHCAIGRLDPTAAWVEGEGIHTRNRYLAINALASRLGIVADLGDHKPVTNAILAFGEKLQCIHDDVSYVMNIKREVMEEYGLATVSSAEIANIVAEKVFR